MMVESDTPLNIDDRSFSTLEKNEGRQVNKKFEMKYRDCLKRNGDKIGTQTCYDIST